MLKVYQEEEVSIRYRSRRFIQMIGGLIMIDSFFQYLSKKLHSFTLWGYGWKRRRTIVLSSPVEQWQDPMTGLWYGEKVALRLLRVNVLDYYRDHR